MKIALYIEDGLEQIVLTPQSDTEKAILGKLHDGSRNLGVCKGQFYACQGGWVRHRDGVADSTMIVLRPTEPKTIADLMKMAKEIGLEEFIREEYR